MNNLYDIILAFHASYVSGSSAMRKPGSAAEGAWLTQVLINCINDSEVMQKWLDVLEGLPYNPEKEELT